MFHPWRRLRDQQHIDLAWRRMPTRRGMTVGSDLIVLHPDQLQRERRCTLAHELVHIEMGHDQACTAREDCAAQREAARWLIEMDDLLSALHWADDLYTVADELWVDEPTLMTRLDGLTADERAQIVALHEELDRPC